MGAVESSMEIEGAMFVTPMEGTMLELHKPRVRRKRNCLQEEVDPHSSSLQKDKLHQPADQEKEADGGWEVGSGYVVLQQPCSLRTTPAAEGDHLGDVKPGVALVLLPQKTQKVQVFGRESVRVPIRRGGA